MAEPKIETCDEAVVDFAKRFALSNPKPGDIDGLELFQVAIPAATRATLTFRVAEGFIAHTKRILVDFNLLTDYSYTLKSRGVTHSGDNDAPFAVPEKETEAIVIIIDNNAAVGQTYSGRIEAWASDR